MSLTKYFAIAVSQDLSMEQQINAVRQLKDYFETNSYINTGDETYYPAAVVTDPVLAGTIDPVTAFKQNLFCAELTGDERRNIEDYGFETYEVGPSAFNLYLS